MDIKRFKKLPILGILRGVNQEAIEPLIKSIISSGLETIEIAINTKDAPRLIEKARRISKDKLMIGAGTVLDMHELKAALSAGATFIVTPVLIADVMEYCRVRKVPIFPGALTPSEIFNAHRAGAAMVKVFPSGSFGPEYFKELRGPFDDIKLLACGGVTPDNMKTYFENGANAVAFGNSVFKKEWLLRKDFDRIEECVGEFVAKYKKLDVNAHKDR